MKRIITTLCVARSPGDICISTARRLPIPANIYVTIRHEKVVDQVVDLTFG